MRAGVVIGGAAPTGRALAARRLARSPAARSGRSGVGQPHRFRGRHALRHARVCRTICLRGRWWWRSPSPRPSRPCTGWRRCSAGARRNAPRRAGDRPRRGAARDATARRAHRRGRGGRPRGGGPPPIVRLRSRDEIGTLTAAFNRMAVDLRRAERELVDAAKFAFVGELAAGVAHEVRTPLGVLRSSAQLLERSLDAKDDEARELLQLLRDEVDRIERVVSGSARARPAARASRRSRAPSARSSSAPPTSSRPRRARSDVSIAAPAGRARIRRRSAIPSSSTRWRSTCSSTPCRCLPDGGSVEVGAAAAARRLRGVRGPRRRTRHERGGCARAIFEPFFTRRDGGAGLGLTFVQRVVLEHRGRISVDSALGSGTVFRVELPVPEASRMKRLLVVDDDARMRRVLQILAQQDRSRLRGGVRRRRGARRRFAPSAATSSSPT